MNTAEILAQDSEFVLHTYNRAPFVLDRGEGVRLYDLDGNVYLDFVSGIAVNALGYGDPDIVAAITGQAARLSHVSNLYCTAPQAQLAQMLVEASFADKVYYSNSGAESVEAAIKFARKWAKTHHGPGKADLLAFSGAFHGRTMGALALTPRPHYQDPFRPLMPGARIATYNDLASAEEMMDDGVCAVIVEPLQGEGGVCPAQLAFMEGLRDLCDRSSALLIYDEVQCGLARTGDLWAHEMYGVTPDLMTLAKPLGAGLPMGATLLTQRVADAIEPGDHASTFAANPIVAAAAVASFTKLSDPEFLEHVRWIWSYLQEGLLDLQTKHSFIQEVRGRGAIVGIQTDINVAPLMQECYERGMLTLNAGPEVLRLLPPLVVEQADLDQALAILDSAFSTV